MANNRRIIEEFILPALFFKMSSFSMTIFSVELREKQRVRQRETERKGLETKLTP